MPYTYGVLRTDDSVAADKHNNKILGPNTLGVEVTDPIFAARCGLGNYGHEFRGGEEISVCEVGLECPLLPDNSIIVTIRPDKDAFAFMALAALRKEGREHEINKMLVASIGALDRCGDFHSFHRKYPELADAFDGLETNAMNVIARELGRIDVASRINDFKRILTGRASRNELERIVALRVRTQRQEFEVERYGDIGFVQAKPGKYDEARSSLGNRYPIGIVYDPGYHRNGSRPHKRYCVIFQKGGNEKNWDGFLEAINRAEAKARRLSLEGLALAHSLWGGHRGWNVSSPVGYGRETVLSKAQILQIADKFIG